MNLTESGLVFQKHFSNYIGKGVDFAKRALVDKMVIHLNPRLISNQLTKQKAHMISEKAAAMASWDRAYIWAFLPIQPYNLSDLFSQQLT